MKQQFADDLRADTINLIVPVVSIAAVLVSLLSMLRGDILSERGHFLILFMGSIFVGTHTRALVAKGNGRRAAWLFLTAYLLMLSLIVNQEWHPGSPLPYLYGLFVVISAMILEPTAGFGFWLFSTAALFASVLTTEALSLSVVGMLIPPVIVNFLLAAAAFLSAAEWNFAVNSVSELHRKAQHRRDELFAIQEELKAANLRLQAVNEELDRARETAVAERDMRTRFMNNVSHELRTPLNAIVNFAHILAHGGRGPVSTEQADYLHRIEQAGFHLLNVLNDILDMAQIEAGEFKLRLEKANLQPLCEEAMVNVRGLIMEKEIELIRDYPDVWPTVEVDTIRFKQALLNLLGNAAKYTEKGHIALRVKPEDDQVKIIVEDTGIGIDPAHHEAIFKEFRQLNEADARKRIGTGLGLPITRHLIRRHGGDVVVKSEVGKGSQFIVTLPICADDAVETADPATETEPT